MKWSQMFPDITLNWKSIYTNTLRATKYIKVQNFQYKYLTRIIPNNNFLFKCKLVNSALRDFCNMDIETNTHMFWECIHVQQFWRELVNFLHEFHIDTPLSLLIVTFGITHVISRLYTQVKNFIIIAGKYFIFKNKYQKTIPSVEQFKSYLKYKIKIEKEIYLMKVRFAQFERKWGNFVTFINNWSSAGKTATSLSFISLLFFQNHLHFLLLVLELFKILFIIFSIIFFYLLFLFIYF